METQEESKLKQRKRNLDHSVQFEDNKAVGWKLNVGTCFRPALDILLTERIIPVETTSGIIKKKGSVYTEGEPSVYSFEVGDSIGTTHYPSDGNSDDLMVQVMTATPDHWDPVEGKVVDGWVQVQVLRPKNPSGWKKTEFLSITQRQFVEILKTGIVPAQERGII